VERRNLEKFYVRVDGRTPMVYRLEVNGTLDDSTILGDFSK
jgi:hypothetical protein